MSIPIRVLIVDDHLVVRAGIKTLLALEPEIEVVGEARDGSEAVSEATRLQPDVILMDIVMPHVDGVTAIQRIIASQPQARILVLTSYAIDEKIFPAIRAGALGYTLKDFGPADLANAIQRVYRGESLLHPTIARRVLRELAQPPRRSPTMEPLTEREMEVLRSIACGASNQEIATNLGIGEGTVRGHVTHILSKLHLASRTQAALYALREGIVSLDERR